MANQTNVIIGVIIFLFASVLVLSIFYEKIYLASSRNSSYCNSVKISFPVEYTDLYDDESELPLRATQFIKQYGRYEIKWENLKLKDFPKKYYQFSNTCASILDLDYNLLTQFPESIENFNGLEVLRLKDNRIKEVKDINQSLSVRYIDLEDNYLKAFPYELLKFESLTELQLTNNNITIGLSDSLIDIEMSKIREIDLTNNELEIFPTHFGKLEHLASLNLFQNKIQDTIVLDGFNALTHFEVPNQYVKGVHIRKNSGSNLRVIRLANNRVAFFEIESRLEEVKELDLRMNYLKYFPEIEKMPNLRKIDVSYNGYLDIPKHILKLENLQMLIIAGITYSDDSRKILKQLSGQGVTIKTGENTWFE